MSQVCTEERSSSSGSQPQSIISQPSEDVEASVDQATRLESFNSYPLPHNVNVIHLARHGFMYRPSKGRQHVSCTGCKKVVEVWNVGDEPFRQQFHEASCQFVRDRPPSEHGGSITDVESLLRASVAGSEESTKPLETTGAASNVNPTVPTAEMQSFLAMKNVPAARHAFSLPPEHTVSVTRMRATRAKHGGSMDVSQIRAVSRQESGSEIYGHRSFPVRRVTSPTPSVYSSSQPGSFARLSPLSTPHQSMSLQISEYQPYQPRLENPDEFAELLENLDTRSAENRLYTFEHFWSEENEFRNVRLLVVCGFYCFGQGDAVRCFCCHVEIANWTRNDNPRHRHIEMSPLCRFMKGEDCGDTPLPLERRLASPRRSRVSSMRSVSEPPSLQSHISVHSPRSHPSSPQISLGPIAQPSLESHSPALPAAYANPSEAMYQRSNLVEEFPCLNPANEAMREERARLQTFTNTEFRRNVRLRASNETLAQAGLYYTGNRDAVRCWFCGGGLKDFRPEDDPWVEHAKYFPTCEHLLQHKGPAWITSISIQNPNIRRPVLLARPEVPNVVSSPTPLPPPPPRIDDPQQMLRVRENMLEEGMQSEPVLEARQMGFSDERIRAVQMQKIINDGCCYQTTEPLVQALMNSNDQPDSPETSRPQVVRLPGQTRHIHGGNFENVVLGRHGVHSPPDGVHYSTTTYSSGGTDIMINGQTMDEFMANAFNHPLFRGEMDDLMNAGTTVVHSTQSRTTRNPFSTRSTNVLPPVPAPLPRTRASSNASTSSTSVPTTAGTSAASSSTTATSASTQERLRELERERSCKICFSTEADILFQPCGHICACSDCAQRVTSCPVCRRSITRYIRTYHA